MSSYALFLSATVHAFASGPDTSARLFELVSVAVIAIVVFLTIVNIAGGRGAHGRRPVPIAGSNRAGDTRDDRELTELTDLTDLNV
jgi:hypothetical protein